MSDRNRDLVVRIGRNGVVVHEYFLRLPEDMNVRESSMFVLDHPDNVFTLDIEQRFTEATS